MIHRRPKLAIALASAAVALIALSIVSAADVGYHFADGQLVRPEHHQGHVYLHVFGDLPELGILVALAMLVAAGYLSLVHRAVRIGSTVAAAVLPAL